MGGYIAKFAGFLGPLMLSLFLVTQVYAEEQTFNIWEYRISGNTLLNQIRVERSVYPFLGPSRSIQDVEAARAALEQEFRHAGYPTVYVDIPEQEVNNGVVQLSVTEGRVDRLRVTGSRYFSLGKIRNKVPSLAEGSVPHLPTVQKEIQALATEAADRQVTPVMRPGRTPGTLEVDLKVRDELPLHGSVEVNGRNTATTSRTRLIGMLRYDNLWQKFHSASIQYQVSPENMDEVQVLAGTYVFPLEDSRTRVAVYAVHSESESETASAGALNIVGQGDIVGLRMVRPLQGTQSYSHTFTYGVDYKDFKDGVKLTGADSFNSPIAYLPFSLRYEGNLRSEKSTTSFGVGATFGIRGLIGKQQEFENKRIYSQSDFFYVSADLERYQLLPRGFALKARMAGQLANSPLISNEQFGIGGAESVRGYFESQALGDDGIHASAELHTPLLPGVSSDLFQDFHGLMFVDGGYTRIRESLPGTERRYDLLSSGIGLRVRAKDSLNAEMDVAYPLVESGSVDAGETRVHFKLAYEF